MINKVISKNNYERAIITDTLPFDLPIIFNNEGLYDNFFISHNDEYCNIIIEKLIKKPALFSNPIDYNIRKNEHSIRKLSLLHPASQYAMCKFYEEYSELICYYTLRSPFSMRAPVKLSSTYYNGDKISDGKYKLDNVEDMKNDFKRKHSISFFKYSGFNRIYKFFSSGKYYKLEKKYNHFWSMDVSKCFESIYTHSISWATKNKKIIKSDQNTKISALFGQKLDKLMQSSNKNETNGIVVGPEFSRIFAEIILQTIDLNVIKKLENYNYKHQKDYDICRYIDDIFIFSNEITLNKKIFEIYTDELSKFNLHINESKTKKISRPFFTSKSRIILKINNEVNEFSKFLFKFENSNIVTTNIYSCYNVSNRFIDKIKSICIDTNSSYFDVSSYIISSLEQRIRKLIEHYEYVDDEGIIKIKNIDFEEQERIYKILVVFIEIMFYLYTISHSVSSSYVISRGCILVTNFFNSLNSDYTSSIKEVIFNHIVDFSDSFSSFNREQYLSLELINLILITSEFGYEYQFTESFLKDNLFFVEGDFTYFNIITLLYYIKNNSKYDNLKYEVIKSVDKKLMTCNSFSDSSHNIHLALDMISCPYIENNYRTKWLKKLSSVESLGIDDNKLVDAVSSLQNTPWFVNWKKINIFNLLEKKLLKSNY
ncbi:antiviral reverse transcriptase Drt3b [Photobacterium leiognathi]|uniref:antiviral reverse transcriptase Drt3b n=1 Tax=Photobacterium leiognathi TaxID=553611 RepID=UPI002980E485|nr:antiviral reverse transcriptase Drt3b [Photobacterium leiognathi]